MRAIYVLLGVLQASLVFSGFGNFDRVDPKDPNVGIFVLSYPEGNSGDLRRVLRKVTFKLEGNGTQVLLDLENKISVSSGDYCLRIESTYQNTRVCGLRVNPKQTTTYRIAGLLIRFNSDELRPQLGPHLEFGMSTTDTPRPRFSETDEGWKTEILPVLPGTFRFSYYAPEGGVNLPAPVELKVAEGRYNHADIQVPVDRVLTTVRIRFDRLEFPDSMELKCAHQHVRNVFAIWRAKAGLDQVRKTNVWAIPPAYILRAKSGAFARRSHGILQYLPVAPKVTQGTHGELTVSLLAMENTRYEIVANNMPVVIDPSEARSEVRLRRVDVNHVEVRPDPKGLPELRPGSYKLFRARDSEPDTWDALRVPAGIETKNGNEYCSDSVPPTFFDSFRTSSGLDVLPGDYRLVVDYVAPGGISRQLEYFLDLH